MEKRAYKYRFYPTPEQAAILSRTFGCVRYVWNWALRMRMDVWLNERRKIGYQDLSLELTRLKAQPETPWLNQVSSVPLQQTLRNLDRAYQNFFEGRARYPRFKSKWDRQSATFVSTAFSWKDGQLTLAKMPEPLNIRWSRRFKGQPSSVTISKDPADRYFVSFLVEERTERLPVSRNSVGIDLGLLDAVATSDGVKFGNPRFFQEDEKRLAKAQRCLARKKKGSKNRQKARLNVARIHARIADRRNDFLHKLSTRLIRENQTICAESLAVKNMIQNPALAKAISDVGWGTLLLYLDYKARWYDRTFIRIDRFYPSSKRCFECGHIVEPLPLEVRSWTCPECGAVLDRDTNAAKNILAAGLAVSACGEAVRPQRAYAFRGTPRRNRKLRA
jgi:putative transposase